MDDRFEIIAVCDGVFAMSIKASELHSGRIDITEYGNSRIDLFITDNALIRWADE